MPLTLWVMAGALLLFAGCATAERRDVVPPVPVAPGVTLTLPIYPPFKEPLAAQQFVRARYEDRSFTFQSAIEADDGHLRLAVTVPSGSLVMYAEWGPEGISGTTAPSAPSVLSEQALLADLTITYAPYAVLRAALGGTKVTVTDGTSRIIFKNGKPVVRVSRPSGDIWDGAVRFENLAYGYELNILSKRH